MGFWRAQVRARCTPRPPRLQPEVRNFRVLRGHGCISSFAASRNSVAQPAAPQRARGATRQRGGERGRTRDGTGALEPRTGCVACAGCDFPPCQLHYCPPPVAPVEPVAHPPSAARRKLELCLGWRLVRDGASAERVEGTYASKRLSQAEAARVSLRGATPLPVCRAASDLRRA